MGNYNLPKHNVNDILIQYEYDNLDFTYPVNDRKVINLNKFATLPKIGRNYGLLKGIEWIIRKIIVEDNYNNISYRHNNIFKNKLSSVALHYLFKFPTIVKSTTDILKIKEYIHEAFIGTHVLNNLSKLIPNFAYTMGIYRTNNSINVISEYINGQTLFEYLSSNLFNMKDFIFILLQISLALQVAQNNCLFVHNDLTPWNIIIQRLRTPVQFQYMISYDNIITIETNLIPILIDYGKSHVVYNNMHHGFINPLSFSSIQDIFSILITSIFQILNNKYINVKNSESIILLLMNFISNTEYHLTTFTTIAQVNKFINTQ